MMGILCHWLSRQALRRKTTRRRKRMSRPQVTTTTQSGVPLTDEQQIDYMLSEYLGAWQLGDTERMHKFFTGKDVSVG